MAMFAQLVNKYPHLHMYVHVHITLDRILRQMNGVQLFTPRYIKIHFKRPNLLSGVLPSDFPTKTVYAFLTSLTRASCPIQPNLFHLNQLITYNKSKPMQTVKVVRVMRTYRLPTNGAIRS